MGKIRVMSTQKDDQPIAGVPGGTFAIWDAGAAGDDYAPLVSPNDHLDKIALHSALDYIGVVDTLDASQTIPAGTYYTYSPLITVNLGPHGRSGRPMIIGMVSGDGGTSYFTCNGTTFSQMQLTLRGRSFIFQADETNVYVTIHNVGTLSAETLYFRAHILERTFYADRPDNGIAYHADENYMEAAGGTFDTRRRYLQTPSPGQTPDIFFHSGQTIQAAIGDEANELDVGFATHANYLNLPCADIWSTSWPPYIVTRDYESLVFAGTGVEPQVTGYGETGRVYLSNADGVPVFDSSRKTLAITAELKAAFTVPSRAAVSLDTPHTVVHASTPVPLGTNRVLGYVELLLASERILINKPLDMSGTVIMAGIYFVSGGNLYARALSLLSARINGGNLEIVEQYFNRSMAGGGTTALPSYSVKCQVFGAAAIGGIGG